MDRSPVSLDATTAEAAGPAPAPVRTELGLLAMAAVWAVNFSVIKTALAELPPLAFNALRFPLASLVAYAALRRRGPIPRPAREDAARILALGVLGNVVYQLFFILGVARTRAGNASLLLAGTPLLTALASALVGHERVGPRIWVGLAAALAGMVLVVAGGAQAVGVEAGTLVGDVVLFGASVSWAVYTVGSRGLVARYGPVAVTAWTLWIGTVGLVLLGLPGLAGMDWRAVSPRAWAGVGYAGAFGIGLAYLLWYRGVHHVGNTRTAAYSNLVPVLALGVAWAWLGEVPTAGQLVGAAVIIGGVMLAQTGRAAEGRGPGAVPEAGTSLAPRAPTGAGGREGA